MNAPHGKNLVGSYYAPIRIVVDTDVIEVDPETKSMLRSLDMGSLQGIVVQQNTGGWEKKGKRY